MPYYRIKGELLEAETPEEAKSKYLVATQGTVERFAKGAGHGMANLGRNVANMALPESLEPKWASRNAIMEAKQRNAPLLGTPAGKVGAFAGEMAASMPLGGAVGKAVGSGAQMLGTRALASLGARRALAATSGAAAGAIEGAAAAGPEQRWSGALMGGALGGIAPEALRKLGSPVEVTPAARRLMDEGVDLTPGQMNPGGVSGGLEGVISWLPMIKDAREAAALQSVRRALRKGAAPGAPIRQIAGKELDKMEPQQILDNVFKSFKPAYDELRDIPVDADDIAPRLMGVIESPSLPVTDATREFMGKIVANNMTRPMDAPPNFGDLQKLRSAMREIKRKTATDTLGKERQQMASAIEKEITSAMTAAMPEGGARQLADIDKQYAIANVLKGAMNKSRNPETGFSPRAAIDALARSEGDSFSRGGRGDDFSQYIRANQRVMNEKMPVTGARALPIMLSTALLGPTAGVAPFATAAAIGAVKPGRKIMAGNTAAQAALRKKTAAMFADPETAARISALLGSGAASAAPIESQ